MFFFLDWYSNSWETHQKLQDKKGINIEITYIQVENNKSKYRASAGQTIEHHPTLKIYVVLRVRTHTPAPV